MTSTQKDRWAAKAERRTAWAKSAEDRARATLESLRGQDWAFISQPGHIPERARQIAAQERAFELLAKAKSHAEKAANLQAMADRQKGDAERARQAIRDTKDFAAGQAVVSIHYGAAEVVKVNAKTVRIRCASGFTTTQDKSHLRAA